MDSIGSIKLALASLAVLAGPACAGMEEDDCYPFAFPRQLEVSRIAIVAGAPGERLYFYNALAECPEKGDACKTKAYVLPGDQLVVGMVRGEWRCAWYAGGKHQTAGWVSSRRLGVAPLTPQPRWDGEWTQYGDNGKIDINPNGELTLAEGRTKWVGAKLPDDTWVVHFGEFSGESRPQGNRLHLGPAPSEAAYRYECAVDLARVGKFLLVRDNAECGGANVRFDGVYFQASP